MKNDEVIRSIRYMLDFNDVKVAQILKLRGYEAAREEITAIFDESGGGEKRKDSSDELTAYFLDGLILHLRGEDKNHPVRPIETPVTNNMVLKKLRVAFNLKEQDMHAILRSTGFSVSKPELSALFRKKGHKNYRECGDQLLRYFLKGLTMRVREDVE